MLSPARARARSGGFTYLGLIVLVAILGLVGAATLKAGALSQRSAAELELLDIGAAFSDALRSYADATPAGQPQQPPTLQALLRDPRFPYARRHLRRIYVDPLTGKAEWGITYLGDHVGVLAVYSLSDARAIKVGNFEPRFAQFEGKAMIADWRFVASGQLQAPAPHVNPTLASPVSGPGPITSKSSVGTSTDSTGSAVSPRLPAKVDTEPVQSVQDSDPGRAAGEPAAPLGQATAR